MYKELDEQTLARYCSQKDRKAEDELYRRYAVRVNALCRRYLGDEEEAKDLMLETLNQALDRIDNYKFTGNGSLYGWISRIAINKAIDQIRKQRWRTVPLDYWARDNIPEPTEDEMEAIPKEKLREWISELTDMRRAVFNMYCIDGYSHQEIARMLGITETGSTSILAKARKQLKDKITDFCRVNNRTSPREGKSKRVVKLFTLSGRDGRGLFVYLCIRRTIKRDFNTINWNSIGINR